MALGITALSPVLIVIGMILALIGVGEVFHANHHAQQNAAFLSRQWWQLDPGQWLLIGLAKLGLVWGINPVHGAV